VAGGELIIMHHPKAVEVVKKNIEEMFKGKDRD